MTQTKVTSDLITSVDASKLTGSLPASMATDLAPVRSDILKLAIHSGIDGNRAAFNLDDSFIDTFEDDTGITTETTVDRNIAGEYVNTEVAGTAVYMAYNTVADTIHGFGTSMDAYSGGETPSTSSAAQVYGPTGNLAAQSFYWSSPSSSYQTGFYIDYKSAYNFVGIKLSKTTSYGDVRSFKLLYSNDASSWTAVNMTGATASAWTALSSSYQNIITNFDSTGIMNMSAMPNNQTGGAILSNITSFSARYLRMEIGTWAANSNSNVGWGQFIPKYAPLAINATGTLISDTQTASTSRTTASGVIIYEDGAGTSTLGTDLKIYFTANNGTNWTEASSYGTAVTYSGAKKLVKLGSTTVTSGTQIAMKAVWANQSASKEARLHGWAVNY